MKIIRKNTFLYCIIIMLFFLGDVGVGGDPLSINKKLLNKIRTVQMNLLDVFDRIFIYL